MSCHCVTPPCDLCLCHRVARICATLCNHVYATGPCDRHHILPPPYSPILFHVIPECASSLLSSLPCTTPSSSAPSTSTAPSTGLTSALVRDPSRFTTHLTPPRLSTIHGAKVVLDDAHRSANIRSDSRFIMYLFFPTPML